MTNFSQFASKAVAAIGAFALTATLLVSSFAVPAHEAASLLV